MDNDQHRDIGAKVICFMKAIDWKARLFLSTLAMFCAVLIFKVSSKSPSPVSEISGLISSCTLIIFSTLYSLNTPQPAINVDNKIQNLFRMLALFAVQASAVLLFAVACIFTSILGLVPMALGALPVFAVRTWINKRDISSVLEIAQHAKNQDII